MFGVHISPQRVHPIAMQKVEMIDGVEVVFGRALGPDSNL